VQSSSDDTNPYYLLSVSQDTTINVMLRRDVSDSNPAYFNIFTRQMQDVKTSPYTYGNKIHITDLEIAKGEYAIRCVESLMNDTASFGGPGALCIRAKAEITLGECVSLDAVKNN
jgi:hypothetical protein